MAQQNEVDMQLKQMWHDRGFNVLAFNVKKQPAGPTGKPLEWKPYMQKQVPIEEHVKYVSQWGIVHTDDPRCKEWLLLDGDLPPAAGDWTADLQRLMQRVRTKLIEGGKKSIKSWHGAVYLPGCSVDKMQKIAKCIREHHNGQEGKAKIEAFIEKKCFVISGKYEKGGAWQQRDDQVSNRDMALEVKDADDLAKWLSIPSKGLDLEKVNMSKRPYTITELETRGPALVGGSRHEWLLHVADRYLLKERGNMTDDDLVWYLEEKIKRCPSFEDKDNFLQGGSRYDSDTVRIAKDRLSSFDPKQVAMQTASKQQYNMYDAAGIMMQEVALKATPINKELYGFDKDTGIYIPWQTNLEQDLNKRYGELEIEPAQISNTVEIIKNFAHVRQTESMRDLDIFNCNKEVVVLQNGILNLRTWEFSSEFDPELLATRRYPITYDAKAKCPVIMKAIDAWTAGDVKKKQALRELIAITLIPRRIVQKAFVLWGEGGNGKSTFLRLLIKMIGSNNVSTQSMRTMSENEWSAWEAFDKIAIISSDGDTSRIKSTEFFKKLVGGDTIRVHAKYAKAYEFDPDCNVIQTYNEAPEMPREKGIGYVRKVYPVQFTETFQESGGFERALLDNSQEISGLLNWIKPTILDIIQGKGLQDPPSPAEVMVMLKLDTEPVYQFVHENLEYCLGAELNADEVFNKYLNEFEPDLLADDTKQKKRRLSFGRELRRAFDGKMGSKKTRKNNQVLRVYTNIRLKAPAALDEFQEE